MASENPDRAFLWDMLDAARTGIGIIAGRSFDEFAADSTARLAMERVMEIIGEAARRVGQGTRDAHPEIPWRAMIGQRNLLAHEYGRIDHKQGAEEPSRPRRRALASRPRREEERDAAVHRGRRATKGGDANAAGPKGSGVDRPAASFLLLDDALLHRLRRRASHPADRRSERDRLGSSAPCSQLFRTASEDLPRLVKSLRKALPPTEPAP